MEDTTQEFSSTQPMSYCSSNVSIKELVPRLSFRLNDALLKSHKITHKHIIVGRDPACSICLDDKSLSRRHASVVLNDDNICILTDLGSLNGTRRNELLLKPNVGYELRPGDQVRLGNVIGIFDSVPSEEPEDQLTQLTQSPNEEKPRRSLAALSNKSWIDGRNSGSPVIANSPVNDTSSNTSSNLLADIVVDTEEVDIDLMPNASQYVSRSPSPTYNSELTELHTSSGRSRPSLEQSLLSNLLVNETQEHPDDSINVAATKPNLTTQAIAETEPFDSVGDALLTSVPVLRTPGTAIQRTSNLVTPRLSDRPCFKLVTGSTPLPPATPTTAVSSTHGDAKPDAATATPLVYDSEPGISSRRDSLGSEAYGMEFPETQPDNIEAVNCSPMLVEESECVPRVMSNSDSSSVAELRLQDSNSQSNSSTRCEQPLAVDQDAAVNASAVSPHHSNVSPATGHSGTQLASSAVNGSIVFTGSRHPTAALDDIVTPLVRRSVRLSRPVDLDDSQGTSEERNISTPFSKLPLTNSRKNHSGKMSALRSWAPSAADSESTQPMVQQGPNVPRAAVLSPSFTVSVPSDRARTPERHNESHTLESTTVSRSPVVDNLHCTSLSRGYQLDTSIANPITFVDDPAFLATEATEDYESTQPMVQLHDESFRAVQPSVLTQKASHAGEDCTKPRSVTHSRSPTVDDFTRRSEVLTPPNVLTDVDPPSRLVKSTSKRTTLREPHVSSVYLSDAIGMVRFRSSRKSNLRRTATLAESEGSQPEAIEMLQSLGIATGLVRRASQCFPSETPDNRQTVPQRRTTASIKSERFGKSRVLRIPSPVKLPDSILSDDPSQLNGSPDRSMSKEIAVSLEAVPVDSYKVVSSEINERPPPAFKPHDAPTDDIGPSESRSAVAMAGFEESPDGPAEKLPNTSTGRQLLAFSVSVPIVDFSSFSDYVEDHNTSRSKSVARVTTRNSLPTPSIKRTAYEPTKSSRMSLQPSSQSIRNVVSRPRRSCRTKPMGDSISAALQPLRRSRRSTARPPTYSAGSSDSSSEPLPTVRKTLNRARRSTVSKPDDGCAAKRRTTGRLRRISSSDLSNCSDTRNSKSSRILLERCDSNSGKPSNISMRLLFSAVDSGPFTQLLTRMGAVETDDYLLASHLITSSKWKRTLKMLHARARGIPIVSVDWLVACKRVRRAPYPDPTQFLLTSPPFGALRRSSTKANQRSSRVSSYEEGFLQGWSFQSTPTVLPPPTDLARLTDLAGGHWMTDRELSDAVSNLTPCTVIIVTDDEFKTLRSGQATRNLKLNRVLATAVKSLPYVPVDWFLNSLMLRKTPSWPVKV